MTEQFLNRLGLVVGFIGAAFAFMDSWRTGSRFSKGVVRFGYPEELNTWCWRNCGTVGFALITFSFVLQFIASFVH
jgi:hypothetical protein